MNEQAAMMNQQQQQRLMNLNQNAMGMNQMNPQSQPQMLPMNRGYGVWTQPPQSFQKPNLNPGAMKPPLPSFKKPLGPRSNWKGKKVNKHPTGKRMAGGGSGISGGLNTTAAFGSDGIPNFNSYQPPTLNELQHQNQMKTRKFFPKKKFNNKNTGMNMNMNMNTNPIAGNYNFSNSRSAPFAPRNTTSFLIRAKKRGGIASVSPSPVTPSVLPTPIFSPSREVLVDMAKEEWGVDGYGSMKGLIRLRSPGHEMEEEDDEDGSSESDVEEHVEMERRLEHDLSRFEMIYNPSSVNVGNVDYHNVLENRLDDQDSHIAHLEEENLTFKERLFLMERELGDLRRRMQYLERGRNNKEVVENESENESGSREGHSVEDNNVEFSEDNNGYGGVFGFGKEGEDDKNGKVSDVEGKEGNGDVRFVVANNKNDSVVDFENKDDVIAEADNGEGKDSSNGKCVQAKDNNECVQAKDREENQHGEDKCPNMEVNASGNKIGVGPLRLVGGSDICTGEHGVAEDTNIVLSMDVGN